MSNLNKMPNIGKVLALRLEHADIKSSQALNKLGAKTAFLKLKTIYPDSCLNSLYAIAGAIENVRWHYLPAAAKEDLKAFFNAM